MNCKDAISPSKNEVLLKIHVISDSSQSLFPSGYNNWRKCIEIKLKSPAIDNKANIEIIENIAKYFKILQKNVKIVTGKKSREKIISIKNIQKNEVCKKIEESLNGLR
jgi:uncharacterized protein (TIGR00251 family)